MHATKNPVKISKIYAIDLLNCIAGTIQTILKANNLDQLYSSPYINLKHKRSRGGQKYVVTKISYHLLLEKIQIPTK